MNDKPEDPYWAEFRRKSNNAASIFLAAANFIKEPLEIRIDALAHTAVALIIATHKTQGQDAATRLMQYLEVGTADAMLNLRREMGVAFTRPLHSASPRNDADLSQRVQAVCGVVEKAVERQDGDTVVVLLALVNMLARAIVAASPTVDKLDQLVDQLSDELGGRIKEHWGAAKAYSATKS